jgi:hypothetical protein
MNGIYACNQAFAMRAKTGTPISSNKCYESTETIEFCKKNVTLHHGKLFNITIVSGCLRTLSP